MAEFNALYCDWYPCPCVVGLLTERIDCIAFLEHDFPGVRGVDFFVCVGDFDLCLGFLSDCQSSACSHVQVSFTIVAMPSSSEELMVCVCQGTREAHDLRLLRRSLGSHGAGDHFLRVLGRGARNSVSSASPNPPRPYHRESRSAT